MKKGYKRLLFFEIIICCFLLLNSFAWNILSSYITILFLIFILFLFYKLFGFEKDNHRYVKDIILETIIFLITFFLLYYLLGILIGFAKTHNYFSFNSIKDYILPTILLVVLKEYFRYMITTKAEGNLVLRITTIILFILLDLTTILYYRDFSTNYKIFVFIALKLLPSISYNIVSSFYTLKYGYKPLIVYSLIINLYAYLLPIVPNASNYIQSIILFLLPIIYSYRLFLFSEKEKDKDVERKKSNNNYWSLAVATFIVILLVYLTSGYFKYWAIAIASGSMTPSIYKGDVVVVSKIDNKYSTLKKGEVIAFKRNNVIVVHRLVNILKIDNKYYFYTKGDANEHPDSFTIEEDMVVGKVEFKIPFIGKPTVWLNELI